MKADRQSRVWPYLGLLACLFALSVTAPRAWREAALRHRQTEETVPAGEHQTVNSSTSTSENVAIADNSAEADDPYVDQTQPEYPPQATTHHEDLASTDNWTDTSASVVSHSESETVSDSPRSSIQLTDPHDRLAMRFPTTDSDDAAFDTRAEQDAAELSDYEDSAYEDATNGETSTDTQAIAEPSSDLTEETLTIETEVAVTTDEVMPLELGLPPVEHVLTAERQTREATEIELELPSELKTEEPLTTELTAPAEPTFETAVEEPQTEVIEEEAVVSEPDLVTTDADSAAEPAVTHGWAMPQELLGQLKTIEEFPVADVWVSDTRMLLNQLCGNQLPDAKDREELLSELQKGLKIMKQMAAAEKEWAVKAKLLRVQYSLGRRLNLWMAIDALGAPPMTVVTDDPEKSPRLAKRLSEFSSIARGRRQGEAWRRHLQIEDLQKSMGQNDESASQRRRLAHTVLGRMAEAKEHPEQKAFVESEPLANLDSALRDWSAESVDLSQLLENLETYETSRSPYIARQVAEQRQSLIWSPNESDHLVGREIERHYRNANVRLAISDDLMNRFLPKPQIMEDSVNDMIVGATVSGYSRTLNRLQLRLIPDPHKIRMGLEAHGVVHSNTGSNSGPVTVYSRGEASYVARKLMLVSESGLHIWPAVSEANAASNTQGMDTDYDYIPVLRSFVRKMAETQQDELYGEAMSEVESRVRETSRRRLDQEADPRIKKMGQVYEQKVQGPLDRLDLKPTPISMSTTEDRAIIRFRVAGDSQLGAHTPRPCAPSDSVASIQVHESVLNNVADQLMLNGQTFTLPELHRMVAEKLGLQIAEPADLPVDAQVTFADKDAVTIRCDDGKIWVTLSVAELTQGRSTFRNFKATAVYHLISHGLHTELERDGVVQLQGKRLNFREQIALRGVTAKLFSQNRKPQVIASDRAKDPRLAGLSVSQLVVLDGWIGLAIAPTRVVRNPGDTNTSTNR